MASRGARPKTTPDLIALILAIVVAIVVVVTTIALLILELTNPDGDVSDGADAIGKIISVLVGALIGYMAGRVSSNGNGVAKP